MQLYIGVIIATTPGLSLSIIIYGLSMAPSRLWNACSSNPGVGGIFSLYLALFLLHLVNRSRYCLVPVWYVG